jgi:hypothetical protein
MERTNNGPQREPKRIDSILDDLRGNPDSIMYWINKRRKEADDERK